MAKFVLRDARVEINSVDLSDHVSSVTIETQFDEVDVTGFGSDYREILPGLGDASITLSCFQDFAAAEIDATLWPLVGVATGFDVKVRPTSAVISATNPEYTLNVVLLTYSPIAGAVGDASTTDLTFRNASQTGLTRAVA